MNKHSHLLAIAFLLGLSLSACSSSPSPSFSKSHKASAENHEFLAQEFGGQGNDLMSKYHSEAAEADRHNAAVDERCGFFETVLALAFSSDWCSHRAP